MAVNFPRLPTWLCGGGGNSKDREKEPILRGSSLNPSSEPEKCPPKKTKASTKKMRRGWLGREEEHHTGNVLFPEPDDTEWSIGWVEPHGPDFKTTENEDDDGDNGFVVLVPCYKKAMDGSGNQILGVINKLPNGFPHDGKNMEQWLSSMRKL